MKELIERLRTHTMCPTPEECADALERLTKALEFWKNGHMEMTSELFAVKRAQDQWLY